MVKIEGINIGDLQNKLKLGKVEKLSKEVFGEDFGVSNTGGNLFIRQKLDLLNVLSSRPWFLSIYLSLPGNSFRLTDHRYFDKAKELAEKYEANFGGEVTLTIDYLKK